MSQNETLVLGIETSCDDSSIALLRGRPYQFPKLLAHISLSQEKSLREWGGVVPEIAARNHLEALPLLVNKLLNDTNLKFSDLSLIGVTSHPGLLGPLLTGINLAKNLSMLYQKPILGVNHLHAHLEAIHLDQNVSYPYLGLLVSGGHTLLVDVQNKNTFNIIGSTIDDAAGEAFDKGGKIMKLPYPAGPIIDKLAKDGNHKAFDFPIGLKNSKDARFSFSGIKADLRRKVQSNKSIIEDEKILKDLCASYQYNIVEALVLKTRTAYKTFRDQRPIVVGGGVACNSLLRNRLKEEFKNVRIVTPSFCTDNGAMIAGYTLINQEKALSYPDSLILDAKSRFVDKKDYR